MKLINLINQPGIEIKLRELKSLVSCTSDDYQKLYIKPLEIYANQLNELADLISDEKRTEFFQNTLENIIACLKLRQGYMLPAGSDAETCYKEQDAWTYAVYTAALIRYSGLLLIKILLPDDRLPSLSEYPGIFEPWLGFINHDDFQDSAFVEIFSKVRKIKKSAKMKSKKEFTVDTLKT